MMTSKFAETQAEQDHRDNLAHAVKGTRKAKRAKTVLEVCQTVVDEKSATRFRGTLLDSFSASAVLAVHKALSDENKAKFVAMDDGTKLGLAKMVGVAFKLCK